MIYFFIDIVMYIFMSIGLFYILNRRGLSILDFIILMFNMNIYLVLIYREDSFIIGLLITILTLLIKGIYEYVFKKGIDKESILIREGMVNFHELVNSGYGYDKLVKKLKRKKIMIDEVEYCIKKDNDLLIIKKGDYKYPISLIIEGMVIENNLTVIKKDYEWLEKELNRNDLIKENVDYAYYRKNRVYFITNM